MLPALPAVAHMSPFAHASCSPCCCPLFSFCSSLLLSLLVSALTQASLLVPANDDVEHAHQRSSAPTRASAPFAPVGKNGKPGGLAGGCCCSRDAGWCNVETNRQ
eukprot:1152284-Pelagomonas_calceolata.AAC.2